MSWDWHLSLIRPPRSGDLARACHQGSEYPTPPLRLIPEETLVDAGPVGRLGVPVTVDVWTVDWEKAYRECGVPDGAVMTVVRGDTLTFRWPDRTIHHVEMPFDALRPHGPWMFRKPTRMIAFEEVPLWQVHGGQTARDLATRYAPAGSWVFIEPDPGEAARIMELGWNAERSEGIWEAGWPLGDDEAFLLEGAC